LGLFHNCGIPLMLQRFPGYMAVLEEAYASTNAETRVIDIENRVLNTNHAVVGFFVARSWKLPQHLCDVIANHHNALTLFRDGLGDGRVETLLAILKMAEHICACHQLLGEQPDDHEWAVVAEQVLEHVGLSEYDFECMRDSIRELGIG
ncbi:HDOD domain-containing protein, partial [Methylobacterium organophilum]|nr:HDOD domain-containing protein [Methylobacterium organophilum]